MSRATPTTGSRQVFVKITARKSAAQMTEATERIALAGRTAVAPVYCTPVMSVEDWLLSSKRSSQ